MKISPLALQIQKYYANTLARQTSANIRSWRRTRELSFCLLSLPLCSPGAGTNEKTQLSPLGRETHSNKAWEQSQAARSLRQCLGSLSWAPCTGPGLGNCGKKQGHSCLWWTDNLRSMNPKPPPGWWRDCTSWGNMREWMVAMKGWEDWWGKAGWVAAWAWRTLAIKWGQDGYEGCACGYRAWVYAGKIMWTGLWAAGILCILNMLPGSLIGEYNLQKFL